MKKSKHVSWERDYHVVIVPKYRKRVLYGQVKERVGKMLRELSREKENGKSEEFLESWIFCENEWSRQRSAEKIHTRPRRKR